MKKKLPIKKAPKTRRKGRGKKTRRMEDGNGRGEEGTRSGGGAATMNSGAGAHQFVTGKLEPKKPVERLLPVNEFVLRLRRIYVHFCSLLSPSVATLSRLSGVPYETLRHFLDDETHLLCLVNEEKLARSLGHTSEYYRMLVRIWSREESWEIHLRAAVAAWLVQAMAWLQGRDLVLMEW